MNDLVLIYKNSNCRIYTNSSGEVFVQLKRDERVKLRVTPEVDSIQCTAYESVILPGAYNGLPAFTVYSADNVPAIRVYTANQDGKKTDNSKL